ncbi:MAG: hypothetical protein ACF8OB_06855 [Phycisphaeraceae bacterium JB051]
MPGDYLLLNRGQIAVEYWEGQITYDMFVANEHAISNDPDIKQGSIYLVDMRKATTDVTMEQVRQIAEITIHGEYGIRYNKAAIVCTENQTFTQSQMYELSVCQHGLSIITFTSLPIACRWLDVDVDLIEDAIGKLQRQLHSPSEHDENKDQLIKVV